MEEITKHNPLQELLNQRITVFCVNYIYTGKLIAYGPDFLTLADPAVVFETGDFKKSDWQDAQNLPKALWHVSMRCVESLGLLK